MARTFTALSDADLAAVATAPAQMTAVELARRLKRPYFTVAAAVRRLRRAGGWFCLLVWRDCAECARPLCTTSGPGRRTVHPACERARAARIARESRRQRPGQSTPYVRAYRAKHPELLPQRLAAWREAGRQQYAALGIEERRQLTAKLHEADRRDYPVTLDGAEWNGTPWGADDDRYVLEHPHEPARELALQLGRTLWAVRSRRVRLRRRQVERRCSDGFLATPLAAPRFVRPPHR